MCDTDAIRDPQLLAQYRKLLDAHELARMQRLVFARDRHRFLISHALLRCVLSLYGGNAPAAWRFVAGAHGKPALAPGPVSLAADFNLSHSGSYALLALSAGCELTGIDIEFHRPARNFHGLAQRNFASSEAARLAGLAERELEGEFYDIWTLKEAFVKATGEGLARSLADFHFGFDRAGARLDFAATAALEPDPARWRFWCHRPAGRYSAALALRVPAATVSEDPRWFGIVPRHEWRVIEVPCLMRGRRITANRESGGAVR